MVNEVLSSMQNRQGPAIASVVFYYVCVSVWITGTDVYLEFW